MEELQIIIARMEDTFEGEPWYGKAVIKVLQEVDPSMVYKKPNEHAHSLIELLYHMLTWETFTLQQLEEADKIDPMQVALLDWRQTNPDIHTWNTGLAEFTAAHHKIIEYLRRSSGDILDRKANYRNYDIRTLLNGLIEHNIYHIGQVAYLRKLLLP